MKRIFYTLTVTLTIAIVLMACNNSPGDTAARTLTYADTVGLAEFQQWKAHNETLAAVDAYKKAYEKPAAPVARRTTSRQNGKMVSSSENQAKVAKKKGWSKAAKGATIGAGSGAVLGAVIHKRNRALGAVIGGVLGGGVGYGIGRSQDKKDGRY